MNIREDFIKTKLSCEYQRGFIKSELSYEYQRGFYQK